MLYGRLDYQKEIPDYNSEIEKVTGYIEDENIAKELLVKFMRQNLNWSVELMSGATLFPYQEMIIRAMFQKDFFLAIAARASAKSFVTSIFCWLYCIFNPGTKIGIISSNFRQSQQIFNYIEKLAFGKNGGLLSQCVVGKPVHANAQWILTFGTSSVTALPLGMGDKLRGFRFNVMVVDELLLVPEHIINEVILPFLAANSDPTTMDKIYKDETRLIEEGKMTEEDRTKFGNNKFIGLSSASYQCEYLYRLYTQYLKEIYNPDPRDEYGKPKDNTGYGVFQFSYEVPPKFIYNADNISKFKEQMSEAQFNREFNSVFTDDSGGYFSKAKMDLCTVKHGEFPSVEIIGDKDGEYLLAIDPSWSKAENSDHFAMGLFKLDKENKHIYLVHNYALPGGQVQDHLTYLCYLLKNFNIVYIIIDSAGSWFLEDANHSTTFNDLNLSLEFFEADFENPNYMEGVRRSKEKYNLPGKKICHLQRFSADWIRQANERLSSNFDHRTVKFASRALDGQFEKLMDQKIPIDEIKFHTESESMQGSGKQAEFIDHQGYLIDLVKSETALIQINVTTLGTQTFTLPQSVKRDHSANRSRRDNYTTLLLGSWASKCYFDMLDHEEEEFIFEPTFFN